MTRGSGGAAKEGESIREQERSAVAGTGSMLEGIQEGSRRHNFKGVRGRRRSCMGERRNINAAVTADMFRVTNATLETENIAPLVHSPGLELNNPIMSNP